MEFLTAKEMSKLFRCSRASITRLAKAGTIPAVKLRGRLLFRKQAVEQFIAMAETQGIREEA